VDLRTLFFAQTGVLGATAAMLWFARGDADRQNGMRLWTAALGSQALAYLVLGARGLPPALAGTLGNAAGAVSVALFFAAIRRFAGLPLRHRPLLVMIAVVTAVGGVAGSRYAESTAFNGFAYAVFEWLNARALWRTTRTGLARIQRVVALFYAGMGIVLPVRALALAAAGADLPYLDLPLTWQEPVYVFGFVYLIVTNLGFVLMCKGRAEMEVRQQARTDDLTGLANRRALDEAIAAAIAGARRSGRAFAVVMADVDRFKAINDGHGHAAGDAILAAFARRLQDALRASDRAFRYGGEEFGILLPDTDAAGARALAEHARRTVALPAAGGLPALTASFGIALWEPGDEADELFGRADRALYRAKSGGRDRVEMA